MIRKIMSLVVFVAFALNIFAQSQSESGHFLVEFDAFSPPVKDMIASFEGKSLIPFMATDLKGKEHFNGNYKGKTLLLYFWNETEFASLDQLNTINNLMEDYPASEFQVISFYDNDKVSANNYVENYWVKFPVIANSKILSEMAYGSELGYPRLFIVDKTGITRKVVPAEAFNASGNAYLMLRDIVEKIHNK